MLVHRFLLVGIGLDGCFVCYELFECDWWLNVFDVCLGDDFFVG